LESEIGDRLVNGDVGPEPREPWTHQATCIVFCIRQQRSDLSSRRIVQQTKKAVPVFHGRLLDQVRDVIRWKNPKIGAPFMLGHRQRKFCLVSGRKIEKKILSPTAWQGPERPHPLIRVQM
jgi:hypothetical protein